MFVVDESKIVNGTYKGVMQVFSYDNANEIELPWSGQFLVLLRNQFGALPVVDYFEGNRYKLNEAIYHYRGSNVLEFIKVGGTRKTMVLVPLSVQVSAYNMENDGIKGAYIPELEKEIQKVLEVIRNSGTNVTNKEKAFLNNLKFIEKELTDKSNVVFGKVEEVLSEVALVEQESERFLSLVRENELLVDEKYSKFDTDITEANQTIDDILALQPQFQAVLDETTGKDVISAPEIILARNGEANLKARLDKEHQEVTAQLAQKAQQTALEVEKERINNLIALPDGSTTNDARLEDIAIGYDGTVYDSPGEAVRQQFGATISLESIPKDKTVTPLKTTFFKTGKNLFDKSVGTPDVQVNQTDGTLFESVGSYTSDFIMVEPNTVYSRTQETRLAYYDADKNFISGILSGVATTPANCVYIRCSMGGANKDIYQLEKGPVKTSYEAYSITFDTTKLPTNNFVTTGMLPSGRYITSAMLQTNFAFQGNTSNIDTAYNEGNYLILQHSLGTFPSGYNPANVSGFLINHNISDRWIIQTIYKLTDTKFKSSRVIDKSIPKLSAWDSDTTSLATKKLVAFGDSVTDFGNYPEIMGQKTGFTTYNCGFGGTRLAQHSSVNYDAFGFCALVDAIVTGDFTLQDEKAPLMTPNPTTKLTTLKSIDFNTVDFITILYGTNDYSGDVPLGVKTDNTKATFYGAFNYSIDKLLTAFPHLQIALLTPFYRSRLNTVEDALNSDDNPNTNGTFLIEYADVFIERATKFKIPVLDLYRTSGINKYTHSVYLADGVHPSTPKGYEYLGNKIGGFITANF